MTEYVEETIARVKPAVKGVFIVTHSGFVTKSTFELSKKENDDYAKYITLLTKKATSMIRDLDPTSDLSFLRIKTRNEEIMVTPDKDFILIAIQSAASKDKDKKEDEN